MFHKFGLDPGFVRLVGIILVVLSTLGFVLSGMGTLGVPELSEIWQAAAGFAVVVSLILLILFWHPWIVVGVLIDIELVVLTCLNSWPS